MMWLALLPYVLTGQPVYVQDDDGVNGLWYGRIVSVLPGVLVMSVTTWGAGVVDPLPYLVFIPMTKVHGVHERCPAIDRNRIKATYDGPDGTPATRR